MAGIEIMARIAMNIVRRFARRAYRAGSWR
jgi:hypothetical protein